MPSSAPIWTGCIALGLTLPVAVAHAAPPPAAAWLVATSAAGQFTASREKQVESEKLLGQARTAIKQGEFDKAEELIAQAEKVGARYNALTERFVDTPEKLRKLLAEQRAKAGPAARTAATAPGAAAGSAIPPDPVSGRGGASPQAVNNVVQQLTEDGKSKAQAHLNDARAALARGDKLAALAAWQKAAAIRATFGPGEPSPQSVADELVRAGIDPSRLVPVSTNSPSSPYLLRPSDIAGDDRLPQLATPGAAVPTAAAPPAVNPYNLPTETNPLAQSSVSRGGGAFQPVAPAESAAPAAAPAAPQPFPAPGAFAQPQRLPVGDANAKTEALRLIAEARLALDKGDLQSASQLAAQAEALNVPDEAFAPGEMRPWQLALEVNRQQTRRDGVMPASGNAQASEPQYPVARGVYHPEADNSRLMPASSQSSVLAQPLAGGQATPGQQLYEQGLRLLQGGEREAALQKFSEAWRFQDQLDPETRQQLKDKLTFMRAAAQPLPQGGQQTPIEQVQSQQELLRQKFSRELANEEKAAEQLAETNPKQALENLRKFRDRISAADLDPAGKKYLLTMVDQRVNQLAAYIEHNKATIENDEQTRSIKAEIVRSQEVTLEMQNKLADMVEQFNKLMEEKRFPEAEVIARQAREIAPNEAVTVNMIEKARLARAISEDLAIRDQKEDAFIRTLNDVDRAAVQNVGDDFPIVFGDVRKWEQLTRSRARWLKEQDRLSPVEQEIHRSLSKPVEVRFINRPLGEVLDTLGRMAGVNVYLDPQGLHAEGVTSDTQVTLNLTQPISLKSALNLILSPLGLGYVVQNEVLRITSEQTRNSNVYARVYYVADLVMPIPNFVPNYNLGLPGAIRESLNSIGFGITPRSMAGPLTVVKDAGQPNTMPTSADVLAQINQFGAGNPMLPSPGNRPQQPGAGPGGLGGGSLADFDSLIELITTTIAPQTWDDVGGPGSIEGFDTNLSLVVSQTQDVHEQIADLLEQLRRLQDLQVTIEVRFITLADSFFERIGVDFNFAIDDNTNLANRRDLLPDSPGNGTIFFDDSTPSISFGLDASGSPTADLDIPFTQGSFGSTTPAFGDFDANSVANFGFAILSDIEVFFLLQAAQGDNRANILQAPKVTLFNGQTAFVSDTTQRPFVTSVIPVVGDFAAAQMPVIVVLNEGTSMSVQAVVSSDRRFVRLTMVPFFSQIGDVDEFTFQGKTTTDSGTTVQDPSNPDENVTNNQTKTVEGTTVQLPTFAFTTVTTTVSVPDGGTVLLGGIKRMREGRVERGVPILSKLPWVSRLFKNVGIGREAQSLMMMVTPRIIIQEEEEERLGISLPQ